MRLSVSNLALPENSDEYWRSSRDAGVEGIEVAPTRIAAWDQLSGKRLEAYRSMLAYNGLVVSSLQAIFYGVPDIALLQDKAAFDRMHDHLRVVAEIGASLGAGVVVFGAPKQRSRGEMSAADAFRLGAERLAILAETMGKSGLAIGLEPVPSTYNGDFLPTWQEVDAMVRHVDHPALRVHLDTGCVLLGDGDIAEAITSTRDLLVHFHIAEPMLTGFDAPQADHAKAAMQLDEIAYLGWLAIEMLEQKPDPFAALEKAVEFAMSKYFAGSREEGAQGQIA